ncbi:MAG: hypothetical protein ACTS2F_21250 [Thainema sp.]
MIGTLTLGVTAIAPAAQALNYCRTVGEHEVCLLDVKRSAKNYWEYRAVVSVDGKQRPLEIYNCRQRIRIREDGTVVPFEAQGAGVLICKLLD